MHPTLEQHHAECPERHMDSDSEAVQALKAKLARCCTIKDRQVDMLLEERRRASTLEGEVRRLRALGSAVCARCSSQVVEANAVHCPTCDSPATLLTGQVPDHDIFYFRCTKCRTEFRA